MNRQEFIRELRKSMSGHFSASEIQENVDYYEDYIDMQLRKGKSEAEVLEELGDPRLLIKSMKAAGKGSGGLSGSEMYREVQGTGSAGQGTHGDGMNVQGKIIRVPCIVWIIGLVLICILIAAIMGAVFSLVLRIVMYLLPVVLIAGGLYWLYQKFMKK